MFVCVYVCMYVCMYVCTVRSISAIKCDFGLSNSYTCFARELRVDNVSRAHALATVGQSAVAFGCSSCALAASARPTLEKKHAWFPSSPSGIRACLLPVRPVHGRRRRATTRISYQLNLVQIMSGAEMGWNDALKRVCGLKGRLLRIQCVRDTTH